MERVPEKSDVEIFSPYVAEFVGTFVLVFTAGACGVAGDPAWNATAVACVLMVFVYAFGPVSGGHFNPAVSLASAAAGYEPWGVVGIYALVQVVAGLFAGLIYGSLFEKSVGVGPPANSNFEVRHVGLVETVYTAMLCFVVLNVAYARLSSPRGDQNHYFALAIGFVIVAGGYAGGGVSGACFNPAVSLGLDVTRQSGGTTKGTWWAAIHVGFQVVGALLGALLFRLCRPEERLATVDPGYQPSLRVRMLREFVSTFILVFTVGLNLVMKTGVAPWSAAASLMCVVYALGSHVNPAVTLAVTLSRRGKCSPPHALALVAAQLLACLLAAFAYGSVRAKSPHAEENFCLQPPMWPAASPGEEPTQRWAPVFWGEFLFTFLLCITVLAVATSTPPASSTRQLFQVGLAIGACVTAGGFACGPLGCGVLNPAVAVGITAGCSDDALGPQTRWDHTLYFSLFQLAGGALAAPVFAVTHHYEFSKGP